MKTTEAQSIRIETGPDEAVSALVVQPPRPRACYVFAHGAGAGMSHASMETVAAGLAARDIATLRYQFPYMEKGSKRPDAPKVAHAAVRAAVAESGRRFPSLPLIAGGRSFGGRMTSQAQADAPEAWATGRHSRWLDRSRRAPHRAPCRRQPSGLDSDVPGRRPSRRAMSCAPPDSSTRKGNRSPGWQR